AEHLLRNTWSRGRQPRARTPQCFAGAASTTTFPATADRHGSPVRLDRNPCYLAACAARAGYGATEETNAGLFTRCGVGARARSLVTVLVQGVFFRREVTDLARRLGLAGWVRNLSDGRVETLVEGEKDRLDELIKFCHVGPRGARVRNVEVEWSDYKGEFRGFKITR